MHEQLRQEVYSLADEDVVILRDSDGGVVLVPRSVSKLGPEAREVCDSVMRKGLEIDQAVRELDELVDAARDAGLSWDAIGWAVGTTGSAARQRWGTPQGGDD